MFIELHTYIRSNYGFLPPKVASTVQTAAPLLCTGASENQNEILNRSKKCIATININP